MSNFIVSNTLIKCSYGTILSPLTTLPKGPLVRGQAKLAATINDYIPMANIKPFGSCQSPLNPFGMGKPIIPTPCPCIPTTVLPWSQSAIKTKINSQPALLKESKCMCIWGGQISIIISSQMITTAK